MRQLSSRRALRLAAVAVAVGSSIAVTAAQTRAEADLNGTWHVLVHYKDDVSANPETKREIIDTLVEEIVVDTESVDGKKQAHVTIRYRFSEPEECPGSSAHGRRCVSGGMWGICSNGRDCTFSITTSANDIGSG